MKIKQLNVYNKDPDAQINNEYPTPANAFKQPCLQMIVGQRTAGKSYLTSKILAQAHKDKTFDVIYIVTPSFNSNKGYFGKYIKEENVFEPTKESISQVIERVEADRDEWEEHLAKKELYKEFKKKMKNDTTMSDDDLINFYEMDFFNEPPKWKYITEEPPKSLLILDDCLGSPAILQSSGLTKIATLNRHLSPLNETHSNRSACGLAVILLTQSYKCQNGISRILRENLSLLTLFKNKQEQQVKAIKDELANVVDEELFNKAYEYAPRDKYGSLTVDFQPKCSSKVFRKDLNKVIMFDELNCQCKNKV